MRHKVQAGIALAGVSLLLAACGGGSSTSSTTAASSGASSAASASGSASGSAAATTSAGGGGAAGGAELLVWADNSANAAAAIEPLCQQWAEENGVTCTVQKFNGPTEISDQVTAGNASGDVPDIFMGAHDRIGTYTRNGILAPIDLASKASEFSDVAVQAVTYEGSTYGVPWAVENVALLTNKALSPACPGTLDEAVANATTLISSGQATSGLGIAMQIGETGDAYHWYPMFSADGGYAFAQNPDGTYNPEDMGIGKEGSIAAATRLQELVNQGIVQASVTYDIAKESFAGGKSPYFITGPWSVPEMQTALGENLTICPVPNWEGSSFTAQPFLGVQTIFQTAKAKNPTLASTFLSDAVMTTEFMDAMYAVDPRPPAWTESYEKAAQDPITKGFGDYGQQGIPMPSIPQMTNTFEDWGLAEFKVASGAEAPEPAMVAAGESINQRNAALG